MFNDLFSRNGLSLDRLRNFLEVAEVGSIAKAAPNDVSRQSLISRQIRELEEFFGVELTVRRGKTLAISPAGERSSVLIREQFRDLLDFQREQRGEGKTFSFGAGASLLEWLVLPAASRLREALGSASLQFTSLRSLQVVEAVRDGRLDFGVVRQDAVPEGLPFRAIATLTFHLCLHERFIGGTSPRKRDDPALWAKLPFAANAGGGQLDRTFREAMVKACGSFRPAYECDSLLQIKELVKRGVCAGVLGSIGTHGLEEHGVQVRGFAPLADYGRPLVLHWNERQMRRRGIEPQVMEDLVQGMKHCLAANSAKHSRQ
jgi:DNA-binding transcriptional LysR family regulator